jgi:flap endonuclease-1
MGIKSLHNVLQEHAPKCYNHISLASYAFKKVAIDISLFLFKFKATAGDQWIVSFIDLISCLRKWDVHTIFIYDGKAPIEKLEEQQRRKDSQAKQKENIKILEAEVEEYEKSGNIGNMILDILKKEGIVMSLFRKKEHINIEVVKDKLERMKAQSISINDNDIKLTKDLFDILQVPYFQAPAEAECYASILCVKGIVDAVLSEDTDVLVYGTPLFLTKLDMFKGVAVEINHASILEEMGLESNSFKDLCIMLGCDYNSNIANYGPKKAYELIKEFKTIEAVLEKIQILDTEAKAKLQKKLTKEKDENERQKIQEKIDKPLDTSVLKYTRCREMFSIPEELNFYVPYCGCPDFDKVSEFLSKNSIRYNIEILKKNLSPRELVFEEDMT